jgi:hypothetical protein
VSNRYSVRCSTESEEPPPKIDLEWERLIAAVPGMQFDVAELLDGDFVEAA